MSASEINITFRGSLDQSSGIETLAQIAGAKDSVVLRALVPGDSMALAAVCRAQRLKRPQEAMYFFQDAAMRELVREMANDPEFGIRYQVEFFVSCANSREERYNLVAGLYETWANAQWGTQGYRFETIKIAGARSVRIAVGPEGISAATKEEITERVKAALELTE